jgi:hypothetical protein
VSGYGSCSWESMDAGGTMVAEEVFIHGRAKLIVKMWYYNLPKCNRVGLLESLGMHFLMKR